MDEAPKRALRGRVGAEGAGNEPAAPPHRAPPDGWVRHDFRKRLSELSPEDPARIEDAHRRFTAAGAERLGALLRQKVLLEPRAVRLVDTADILTALHPRARIYAGYSRALDARIFIALSASLLLSLIERLLGSPPDGRAPEDRALTELEESLARTVLKRLIEAFTELLPEGSELELQCAESEHRSPQGSPQEPDGTGDRDAMGACLVSAISCSPLDAVGPPRRASGAEDGKDNEVAVLIPRGPLLDALRSPPPCRSTSRASRTGTSDRLRARSLVLERLSAVAVTLTAELATEPLPLRELLALEPGDIVDTGVRAETPVALCLDGGPLARGRAGGYRGRLAARVE